MDDFWTEAKVEQLRTMFAQVPHQSASRMAARLGSISRNAVIGKLHRMGLRRNYLKAEKPQVQAQSRTRINSAPRIKPVPLPDLRIVELESRNLAILDLEPNDCRWPSGDQEITFCGHPKHDGSSYCFAHFRLSLRTELNLTAAEHERRRRHFRMLNNPVARHYPMEAAE